MAEDPGQHEAWLSLREAARTLGISEKSVRRRIQAGTLRGRRVDGPYGPAWHILVQENGHAPRTLDADAAEGVWSQPSTADGLAEDPGQPALLEAFRMIEKLQQTVMELSGRCGYLQAELSQAREQLALMAPAATRLDDLTTPSETSLRSENPPTEAVVPARQEEPEPPRGPWGRFLGWLYG
jgi:hypothetical protein